MENEIMDVATLANDITLLIMPFISVLIMVVIASLFFFAADSIISFLIQWLFGIFSF